MTVKGDTGNIGIGTTNPETKIHVRNSGLEQIEIENPAPGGSSWYFDIGDHGLGLGGRMIIGYEGPLGGGLGGGDTYPVMTLSIAGNIGIGTTDPGSYKLYVAGSAYSTGGWSGSDIRWKKNISPLEGSLDKVNQLQGVSYDWNLEEYPDEGFSGSRQVGLIAQEVETVIPELVHTDDNGYKSVSYEKLTAVLVEALKELKTENEALKALVCPDHTEAEICR